MPTWQQTRSIRVSEGARRYGRLPLRRSPDWQAHEIKRAPDRTGNCTDKVVDLIGQDDMGNGSAGGVSPSRSGPQSSSGQVAEPRGDPSGMTNIVFGRVTVASCPDEFSKWICTVAEILNHDPEVAPVKSHYRLEYLHQQGHLIAGGVAGDFGLACPSGGGRTVGSTAARAMIIWSRWRWAPIVVVQASRRPFTGRVFSRSAISRHSGEISASSPSAESPVRSRRRRYASRGEITVGLLVVRGRG